ncbi:MAG: hypothetical protein ACREKM_04250 [Longimicrobiales bacterium]
MVAACAGRSAPPTAESPKSLPPDLTGRAVLVLPSQPGPAARRDAQSGEVVAGLDAELAYWLEDRGPRVDWTFPAEIRDALGRNAMLQIDIDALTVSSFHHAQVVNIGDPLLGDLRRLAALMDARWALVPVAVAYVPQETSGRVEAAVALIDTYGGRVLWYGVMAGEPGARGTIEVAASAARAIALTLLP